MVTLDKEKESASFWAGYRHRLDGNKFNSIGYLYLEYRKGWFEAFQLAEMIEQDTEKVVVLSEN